MASRSHAIYNNQNAINYINKKGIDGLFEVGIFNRIKITKILFDFFRL